jgi:hypothetical protein
MQLGGLILGYLQHLLDPRGRGSQRGPLQAIELAGSLLGLATEAINLPGRLTSLTTQQFEIVAELGGPLQRGVTFSTEGGNAGLERIDMLDDLPAVEAT